jgi:hypothetical protein
MKPAPHWPAEPQWSPPRSAGLWQQTWPPLHVLPLQATGGGPPLDALLSWLPLLLDDELLARLPLDEVVTWPDDVPAWLLDVVPDVVFDVVPAPAPVLPPAPGGPPKRMSASDTLHDAPASATDTRPPSTQE